MEACSQSKVGAQFSSYEESRPWEFAPRAKLMNNSWKRTRRKEEKRSRVLSMEFRQLKPVARAKLLNNTSKPTRLNEDDSGRGIIIHIGCDECPYTSLPMPS